MHRLVSMLDVSLQEHIMLHLLVTISLQIKYDDMTKILTTYKM